MTTTAPATPAAHAITTDVRLDRLDAHLRAIATTVREGFTGIHYALDELRDQIRARNDRDLDEHQDQMDMEARVRNLELALRATG